MTALATYLGLAHRSEQTLADSLRTVGEGHADEPDVLFTCGALAGLSDEHVAALAPVAERYGEAPEHEPERLHADGVASVRTGPVGLLRDLQDLHLLAGLVDTTWTVVVQAAMGARDRELLDVATCAQADTARQLAWLTTRLKQAAPQALLVAR